MESLELFFRFSAIALFAGQIALILRDARGVRAARFYALMAAGIIGFLATHASVDLALPGLVFYPLSFLSKTAALSIWWFVFAVFVDGFRLGRVEYGFAALWIALVPFDFTPVNALAPMIAGYASAARVVLSIALAVYILARLLGDRSIDLVESRRAARLWLTGAILALFIIDLASDYLLGYGAPPLTYSVLQKGLILAFAIAALLLLGRADGRWLALERRTRPASGPSVNPALAARLEAALSKGAHLDPQLSLASLSDRLGAPEHQLRALINQQLGHRNFRAFLNERRVAAAKAALADPDQAELSITAIALDSGFASLASFNRVFKEMVAETPSAYRARQSR